MLRVQQANPAGRQPQQGWVSLIGSKSGSVVMKRKEASAEEKPPEPEPTLISHSDGTTIQTNGWYVRTAGLRRGQPGTRTEEPRETNDDTKHAPCTSLRHVKQQQQPSRRRPRARAPSEAKKRWTKASHSPRVAACVFELSSPTLHAIGRDVAGRSSTERARKRCSAIF